MKKDEILKLAPREFTDKVFTAFRKNRITAKQLKNLCEYYNNNTEGKNERKRTDNGVSQSLL